MSIRELAEAVTGAGFFSEAGSYVLVDGQYGSTGKGVIACALAEAAGDLVDAVVSNAGPNSGHTCIHQGTKIVLKQLPTFGVVARRLGMRAANNIHLSGGAVIDRDLLKKEQAGYSIPVVYVHPSAAIIDDIARNVDMDTTSRIASTGQGVGPAMARKISRTDDAVFGEHNFSRGVCRVLGRELYDKVTFMEVSQGFSLGINSGFYPHVTSRECTVAQALSDASMPPSSFRGSVLSVRTYPIRVGNTENSSGPCYFDQKEIGWDELGVKPEFTTVTGRIRRVFTWSHVQFCDAVYVNDPSIIFLNFCNYLRSEDVDKFVRENVMEPYRRVQGRDPKAVLLGFGPTTRDIKVWRD